MIRIRKINAIRVKWIGIIFQISVQIYKYFRFYYGIRKEYLCKNSAVISCYPDKSR